MEHQLPKFLNNFKKSVSTGTQNTTHRFGMACLSLVLSRTLLIFNEEYRYHSVFWILDGRLCGGRLGTVEVLPVARQFNLQQKQNCKYKVLCPFRTVLWNRSRNQRNRNFLFWQPEPYGTVMYGIPF
jgi:hypothetical protein